MERKAADLLILFLVVTSLINPNSGFGRTHDSTDDNSTRCAISLQNLEDLLQQARTDAQQQAAAGLSVGKKMFLRHAHPVPVCEGIRRFQILAAAAGNAIFRPEFEYVLAEDRHGRRPGPRA